MSEFLKAHALEKSYGDGESRTKVLRGISLSLDKGDFCVLLGPSGSGKSTFLNIIGGLELCDSGTISIEGREITKFNDKQLGEYRRETLGFIFQFYNLVPDLTIRENIEVTKHISNDPLSVCYTIWAFGNTGLSFPIKFPADNNSAAQLAELL